eukprot:6178844-Pleurochrysis_carterae.AAC.3
MRLRRPRLALRFEGGEEAICEPFGEWSKAGEEGMRNNKSKHRRESRLALVRLFARTGRDTLSTQTQTHARTSANTRAGKRAGRQAYKQAETRSHTQIRAQGTENRRRQACMPTDALVHIHFVVGCASRQWMRERARAAHRAVLAGGGAEGG